MPNILANEARIGDGFLHPGGHHATRALLQHLALGPGEVALEIGCGVGATADLIASATGSRVIAVERLPDMIEAAKRRGNLHLVRADAGQPLPFLAASFDAVYAESVIALLDPALVLPELARVLRPGGRLVLNERIWKPGLSAARCAEINALSARLFGIPAATPAPLDCRAWLGLLAENGFDDPQAIPIDNLLTGLASSWAASRRLSRLRNYLASPSLLLAALSLRLAARRRRREWSALESYLFHAVRSP